MFLVETQPFQ